MAWLWLRRPHSRLAQALAVVFDIKGARERGETQQRSRETGQQTLASDAKGVRGAQQKYG